jgi:hypothetical protein
VRTDGGFSAHSTYPYLERGRRPKHVEKAA